MQPLGVQALLMQALHAADRAKAAEALIANGATVDKVDDKGRTALCHAAKYGSIDCIHILGHHNANAFHEDNEGNNPLQIAEDASRFEATNHIRKLQQVGPTCQCMQGSTACTSVAIQCDQIASWQHQPAQPAPPGRPNAPVTGEFDDVAHPTLHPAFIVCSGSACVRCDISARLRPGLLLL